MTATSQIREWWWEYECDETLYERVAFPGDGKSWSLYVAAPSVPVWEVFADIMADQGVLFLESAGGTYNCRPPSLHSYALAIDINPSKNPYKCPLEINMPDAFIAAVESIQANGRQAIQWGGRWPCDNPPDPMHFQINVAPSDCHDVTYGGDMPLSEEDLAKIRELVVDVIGGDKVAWTTPDGKTQSGNTGIVDSVWQSVSYGRSMADTLEDIHKASEG